MSAWAGHETGMGPGDLWDVRDRLAAGGPEVVVVVGTVGLALWVAAVAEAHGGDPLVLAVASGGRSAHPYVVWVDGDPAEVAEEVMAMASAEASGREGALEVVLDPSLPGDVAARYFADLGDPVMGSGGHRLAPRDEPGTPGTAREGLTT